MAEIAKLAGKAVLHHLQPKHLAGAGGFLLYGLFQQLHIQTLLVALAREIDHLILHLTKRL